MFVNALELTAGVLRKDPVLGEDARSVQCGVQAAIGVLSFAISDSHSRNLRGSMNDGRF